MRVDFAELEGRERYAWLTASILPRPIAWVSTISAAGHGNLAPFSYFNGVASSPPILMIVIGRRHGEPKDTLRNIEETRELVVNMVPVEAAEAMVATSGDYASDENEFDLAGLTKEASDLVRPPRVAESPLAMECTLHRTIEVGEAPSTIVLAEVLCIHVKDEMLTDGRPDPLKLKPLGRLGGNSYAELGRARDIAKA